MFNALRDGTIPKGKKHDVYCSNCGTLTHIRTANKIEGEFPGSDQAPPASDEVGFSHLSHMLVFYQVLIDDFSPLMNFCGFRVNPGSVMPAKLRRLSLLSIRR